MATRSIHGWNRRNSARLLALAAILGLVAGCSGGPGPIARMKARLQLKNGNRSYLAGQYDKAIWFYDRALSFRPELAPAYLNRAYSSEALFHVSGEPGEQQRLASEAVRSFETYLGLIDKGAASAPGAPGRGRIEEHILTLFVESQQADKAIALLQARFEKNPKDTAALEMLSHLEMDRGRMDEAMRWHRQRTALEPDSPDALYSLAAFVWLMSYRDAGMETAKRAALLDEGIAALGRALELRPDDFQSLFYINLLYLEKAKYAQEETERQQFEAQAKTYRERALALRKPAPEKGASQSVPATEGAKQPAGTPR